MTEKIATFQLESPLELAAYRLVKRLKEQGGRALFAGGFVRDRLLGFIPKDIDIACNLTPDEVKRVFPDARFVGQSFGVSLVRFEGFLFEVAMFREEGDYQDGRRPSWVRATNEENDAQRRDFTINALFYDPENEKILDYVGGLDDIESGLIRSVGRAQLRFQEDYLRMFRAVRFAARLGFQLAEKTSAAIGEASGYVAELASERVFDELTRIFTGKRRCFAVEQLISLGLLHDWLPELIALKGLLQPKQYHPEKDALTHSLMTLEHLQSDDAALCWAALLHDIGKKPTFNMRRKGKITFHGHPEAGAKMFDAIAVRFSMAKAFQEEVRSLILLHDYPLQFEKMRQATKRRLVAMPIFPKLLQLFQADRLAASGEMGTVLAMKEYLANNEAYRRLPKLLLDGHDLIEMGYRPSAVFKEILDALLDWQLEGVVQTPKEAKRRIEALWHKNRL